MNARSQYYVCEQPPQPSTMLKHLSTTFVGNVELCPKRAWRSYERRNELGDDNEGTNPTRFGTVVHNTMENIHENLMSGAIFESDLTDEYLLEVFDSFWQQGTCYDFDYYRLGRDKIADFIRRSVFNRRGETVATELTFVFDVEANTVVIDPPDLMKVVHKIKANGHTPCASKIDRIDRMVDDDGNIIIEIFDYKTNMLPFTRYEIEESKQLGMYALVGKALYPEATEISCIYDMVRHGRFPVTFPDDFLETLRAYFINLYVQAESSKNEERLNKYCCWCEIRGSCAAYAAALTSPLPTVAVDAEDLEERHAELEQLQLRQRAIENRVDEIKESLSARIVNDSMGEPMVISDTKEIYLQYQTRPKWDTAAVIRTLTDHKASVLLPEVVSINSGNLEKKTKGMKDLSKALAPFKSSTYTKPSLKVRARKAGKCDAAEQTEESE